MPYRRAIRAPYGMRGLLILFEHLISPQEFLYKVLFVYEVYALWRAFERHCNQQIRGLLLNVLCQHTLWSAVETIIKSCQSIPRYTAVNGWLLMAFSWAEVILQLLTNGSVLTISNLWLRGHREAQGNWIQTTQLYNIVYTYRKKLYWKCEKGLFFLEVWMKWSTEV